MISMIWIPAPQGVPRGLAREWHIVLFHYEIIVYNNHILKDGQFEFLTY
jgi:hypothetical protein